MKVYIDRDEWYPVYDITEESRYSRRGIEVDEATAERWWRVAADFEAVQVEMADAWEASFL